MMNGATLTSEQAFGAESTAEDVARDIDLSGRVAVVTGGTSGLGQETARVLARCGARVIITARDAQQGRLAAAKISGRYPGTRVEAVSMELGDLASVRAAAGDILTRCERIDLLINNAGVMACPLQRSAEGYEWQLAANHLGHFLFSNLLLPALRAAEQPRVVALSSGGHKYSPVDFDDPHFEQRDYDKWIAYGQAKTACALFAVALNKRLRRFGGTANAVHPGTIATNLGRHMERADFELLGEQFAASGIVYKSVEQGAATSVWAATAPELAGRGGLYLEDCSIGRPDATGSAVSGYADYALDEAAAERLWQLSEQLVGQRFG